MPPLNLRYSFWGRPLKPMSLAAMLSMIVLVVINVLDRGLAGTQMWGDVVAVLGAVSAACLAAGWWKSSQKMTEYGLLCAAAVWGMRATFALLTDAGYGWALSLCWAVATGGAYLLERDDSTPPRPTTR